MNPADETPGKPLPANAGTIKEGILRALKAYALRQMSGRLREQGFPDAPDPSLHSGMFLGRSSLKVSMASPVISSSGDVFGFGARACDAANPYQASASDVDAVVQDMQRRELVETHRYGKDPHPHLSYAITALGVETLATYPEPELVPYTPPKRGGRGENKGGGGIGGP